MAPRPHDVQPEAVSTPLTAEERNRIEALLESCSDDLGMNLEALDGFVCAVVAGFEPLPASEYLDEVLAHRSGEAFPEELRELQQLMAKHRDGIEEALRHGFYQPVLWTDENGVPLGNDWAYGFVKGMNQRLERWLPIIEDKHRSEWLLPMYALAREHDPDASLRTGPLTLELREGVIPRLALGLEKAYRFFHGHSHHPRRFVRSD